MLISSYISGDKKESQTSKWIEKIKNWMEVLDHHTISWMTYYVVFILTALPQYNPDNNKNQNSS